MSLVWWISIVCRVLQLPFLGLNLSDYLCCCLVQRFCCGYSINTKWKRKKISLEKWQSSKRAKIKIYEEKVHFNAGQWQSQHQFMDEQSESPVCDPLLLYILCAHAPMKYSSFYCNKSLLSTATMLSSSPLSLILSKQ